MEYQIEIAAIAKPARRRFQFRLRTLMIFVTLSAGACAYGTHWYQARKRADAAFARRDELRVASLVRSEFLWDQYVQVGRNWCLAECAVPFSDSSKACQWYLDRVESIEDSIRLKDGSPTHYYSRADLDKMAKYKQEAEQWLPDGTASGEPTELTYPKPE